MNVVKQKESVMNDEIKLEMIQDDIYNLLEKMTVPEAGSYEFFLGIEKLISLGNQYISVKNNLL